MVYVLCRCLLNFDFIDLNSNNEQFVKVMKPKFGLVFKIFLFGSFLFLAYQLLILIEISKDTQNIIRKKPLLFRGIHEKQSNFYEPNLKNTFKCFQSYEEIDYKKVNDDYCDCLDGTDEPGTNACINGIFFCEQQTDSTKYPNFVPSYKVNDGICDCCDGSDEWSNNYIIVKVQMKLNQKENTCSNVCK